MALFSTNQNAVILSTYTITVIVFIYYLLLLCAALARISFVQFVLNIHVIFPLELTITKHTSSFDYTRHKLLSALNARTADIESVI